MVKSPILLPLWPTTEVPLHAKQWPSYAWWGSMASLLAVEVLLLTIRFDATTLKDNSAWNVWMLLAAPKILQIGLLGAMAALLVGGSDIWTVIRQGESFGDLERQSPAVAFYRWGVFLPLHLVALVLFAWLSMILFESNLATRLSYPGVWIFGWSTVGVATFGLWAMSCLPLRTWARLLMHCWRPLLVGLALGIVGWHSGVAASQLWGSLSEPTLYFVDAMLRSGFADTVCDPASFIVGTTSFQVKITSGCSGYQGLGLMAVYLALYLFLFQNRLRFPQALILVPVGMVGVWLLNCARIALLIAIGHWGWPDVASGGFHTQAGLLSFVVLALGLTAIAEISPWLKTEPATLATREPDVAVAYLGPFLALLFVSMVTGIFSSDFDWLYPVRVLTVVAVVWVCRQSYIELSGGYSWTAFALGMAAFVVWLLMARDDPAAEMSWSQLLSSAPSGLAGAWLICRLIGHLATVPLAEELAFRGFLIRQLTRRDFLSVAPNQFSWPAFVVSSLLFGGLHGRSWLAGTLAGMLFALAQRRRGKIVDAVMAHVTANVLLAGYVLISGRWSLW